MKLRCSYTLLSLWKQGRINDALDFYFKRRQLTSIAIEQGKMWDDKVNMSVRSLNALPQEFGGDKLVTPVSQEKWVINYSDDFDLVGVPDIYDSPILYEIKTGSSKDSGDYASDFQVPIYFLLAEKLGKKIEKGIILHYNQHTNELDKSIIWKTNFEIKRAENFIETIGGEIYDYFQKEDLLTN